MTAENSSIDLLDFDEPAKVILPASVIPVGSTVTKATGNLEYIITDGVRVFEEGKPHRRIEFEEGVRVLVSKNGDMNVIDGSKVLGWIITLEELYEIMESNRE